MERRLDSEGETMKTTHRSAVLFAALACLGWALVAQSVPALDPAHTGAVAVSGKISPGAGPVAIYDLSYPAKTKLGDSMSVDGSGNFAVSVKPPLIEGHQIVAVDKNGATSAPATVTKQPAGPAGPGN
jgi:hypothetical protein